MSQQWSADVSVSLPITISNSLPIATSDALALEGARVTLRLLQESFFQDYHRMLSPTVRSLLRLAEHATFQHTCDYLNSRLALMQAGKHVFFCIFDNVEQRLIGAFEIRDSNYIFGQLGVWINEQYWGGGRYQEALDLALNFYFAHSQAQSVNALIDMTNMRSLKAHQKYGFVIVGECMRAENGTDFIMHRLEYARK